MVDAPKDALARATNLTRQNEQEAEAEAVTSLLDAIRESKSLPVGFVGSGFSRRYLSTPDWGELMSHLSGLTGYPLNRYLNIKSGDVRGDYPATATRIASAFSDIWWRDDQYAEQRGLHAESVLDQETLLKMQVAEHLHSYPLTKETSLLEELESFKEAPWPQTVR